MSKELSGKVEKIIPDGNGTKSLKDYLSKAKNIRLSILYYLKMGQKGAVYKIERR